MAALILAVRFLTVLPVPGREATGPGALGRAAWWFPLVGLGLGAALAGLDRVLGTLFSPLLAAAVLVAAWKAATGGLHLDGLADCLDGLAGASPTARLAIMRDSRIGVFGAAGIAVALLTATAAVAELPSPRRATAILLVPAVGRLAPVLLAPWARPATPGRGMGADFLAAVPAAAGLVELVALGAVALFLLGPGGGVAVATALGAAAVWARLLSARLGGLNGDVLGSAVEVAETWALLAVVALARRGAL